MTDKNQTGNPFSNFFRSHPREIGHTAVVLIFCLAIRTIGVWYWPELTSSVETRILPSRQVLNTMKEKNVGPSADEPPPSRTLANATPARSREADSSQTHFQELTSKPNSVSSRFSPNEANLDTLLALGLPYRVASNWIRYIEAGGNIYNQEKLESIYGMTQQDIEKVKDLLTWPKKEAYHSSTDKMNDLQLDINSATVEEWQKLRGIGPVLSERIVKFREMLGGFYSIEQIADTYGISDSLLTALKPQLRLESKPQYFAINHLGEQELAKHPYISYKQARILHLYRKEHGPYETPSEILNSRIVDSVWLEKMKPYLSLE